MNDLRDQLEKNKAALVEKLLLDLLNGNVVTNIDAQLEFLGISGINNRDFQVAVIEIPENQLAEMGEEEKYLLNLHLYQQIKRLANGSCYRNFLVNHHRNQVVLIFIEPDDNLPLRLEEILSQAHFGLKTCARLRLGPSLPGSGGPGRFLPGGVFRVAIPLFVWNEPSFSLLTILTRIINPIIKSSLRSTAIPFLTI